MIPSPIPSLTELAKSAFTNLSNAELRILKSATTDKRSENEYAETGSKTDSQDTNQWVRGELIRWVCTRANEFVDPSGLLIWYARITGNVDLGHTTVRWPFAFGGCHFDENIELHGARLRTLSLFDCSVRSILADGAVLDGAF